MLFPGGYLVTKWGINCLNFYKFFCVFITIKNTLFMLNTLIRLIDQGQGVRVKKMNVARGMHHNFLVTVY